MARPQLSTEDQEILGDLIPEFITLASAVPDPRRKHLRAHNLVAILFIHLSAQMAGIHSVNGATEFAQTCWAWIQKSLGEYAAEKAPSHDTLGRLLKILPTDVLERILSQLFGGSDVRREGEHIAIDGKLLRGSVLKALLNVRLDDGGKQLLTSVNVYSVDRGVVVAATTSPDPGSEHACIQRVLGSVQLEGAIVSMDAGNAHPKFAEQIIVGKGVYLLAIKGNNAADKQACEGLFGSAAPGALESLFDESEARGDKREVRLQYVDPAERPASATAKKRTAEPYVRTSEETTAMAKIVARWPEVKCVIEIWRHRVKRGNESIKNEKDLTGDGSGWTRVFYVCSKVIDAVDAQRLIRDHWHVENKLHWTLDVNYGEDKSLARAGYLPQNLALLRRIATSILAQHTGQASRVSTQRKFAFSESYRNEVWGVGNA